MSELIKILPEIRGAYRQNAAIKNWFDVGGNAEVLFRPADKEDLQNFLKNCPKEIPINIIGAASNVIISDSGIKGVVIKLGGEFAKISHEQELIKIGGACLCINAALYSKNYSLTGLEFFSGIPGSIGGAIAMNAGCYGFDTAQTLVSALAIDFSGNLIELKNSDFGFFYRGNKIAENFGKKFIFIEAIFKTEKSSKELVAKKIAEFSQQREQSQPIRAKTGGSTFKNPYPQDLSAKKAWQLIDEANCRGMVEGDAQISIKHCNFMINRGKASAQNLIDLGNKVKKLVKQSSNIDLEWEIKILE
ncbi:MAG: UDP-N-acetylmuramate dehydrogenase [Rickettsiales bacterium]|nr:UDP-N-acetylmuramate dehydrogenase [Rickettsiales bacterium]